jgi:hypothetical protein
LVLDAIPERTVMSEAARPRSPSARRMAEYRKRMRAKGLKPVTIWVPDKNDLDYIERCRRAVAAINAARNDPEERALRGWVEAATDWSDL